MDASRQCVKCWVEKPAAEFAKDPRVASGMNARCRDCFNGYYREQYAADPEAGRRNTREWRAANPDKVIETRRRHWESHREEVCQQSLQDYYRHRVARLLVMAAYREANREALHLLNAQWRATPAGKAAVRDGGRRRRAAKAGLPSEKYTVAEIVTRDGLVCCLCMEAIDLEATDVRLTLTIEHHIPLQCDRALITELEIEHPGDVLANVGLAHYWCNASKKSRYGREDVARYESNLALMRAV